MSGKISRVILVWLIVSVNSMAADFASGIYADALGNNYMISGPAPSHNNREQWSLISLGNPTLSVLWETGPLVGNVYVNSLFTTGPDPTGVAFGYGVTVGYTDITVDPKATPPLVIGVPAAFGIPFVNPNESYSIAPTFSYLPPPPATKPVTSHSIGTSSFVFVMQIGNNVIIEGIDTNGKGFLGGGSYTGSNYSMAFTRVSDGNLAISSPNSESFIKGVYADISGRRYLVSGPAPTATGRQQWSVMSLEPDTLEWAGLAKDISIQFAAIWETGNAYGNSYYGNYNSLVTDASGYSAGRSYGVTTAVPTPPATTPPQPAGKPALTGSTLSASQTGNVLTLTELDATGFPAGNSLMLVKISESDSAASSPSSESYLAGTYTNFSGTPYIVSGPAPSRSGRSQWSLTSLDPSKPFSALWETGPAVGNSYIGNTTPVTTTFPHGYLPGRSYGITGNNPSTKWTTGSTLAASQTGNVLTLTSLNPDGTPIKGAIPTGGTVAEAYSMALLRTGSTPLATSSASSESFVAGTYTAQDGTVYQLQGSGSYWILNAPPSVPYQFSAMWQTGPMASNIYWGNSLAYKRNPGAFLAGRSYGITGGNSLNWGYGVPVVASQTGNVLILTALNADGTASNKSMTLVGNGLNAFTGNWNANSTGQVQFRESAVSVVKNESYAKVYVSRVGGSKGGDHQALGVAWYTQDGTAIAGVDYLGFSGSLSWADGDVSTKTIWVALKHNSDQGGKTFSIVLENPAAVTLGSPSIAAITILPSITGNSDRVFDAFEFLYPSQYPGNLVSQNYMGNFYYRCYGTACLGSGLGADIDSFYYYEPGSGMLLKVGSMSSVVKMLTGF